MGWRYTLIVLGCFTLAIFFLRFFVFTFHESPKFLLSRGREAEAIEVLHKIAKFNRAPPPQLTVEMFAAIDLSQGTNPVIHSPSGRKTTRETMKAVGVGFAKEVKRIKGVFTNKLQAFMFVLLAIAYMGDYWSFNLAGEYLPIILLRNNVDKGQGTTEETYRQYVYIYLPGILGAVLALISVQLPLVGRKWSLVFSAICQGLAMAMYTQVKTTAGYVGLNALEYIMQTVSIPLPLTASMVTKLTTTNSISTPSSTPPPQNSSTPPTAAPCPVCCPASAVSQASSRHLQARIILRKVVGASCGWEPEGFGWRRL